MMLLILFSTGTCRYNTHACTCIACNVHVHVYNDDVMYSLVVPVFVLSITLNNGSDNCL